MARTQTAPTAPEGETESPARGPEGGSRRRTIDLTPEQAALMLKACLRYRASLPVYLQAVRDEVGAIDSLIAQLR